MISGFRPDGAGPTWFGLYPALVTDIVDPDQLGRVEVKLPWLDAGAEVRAWATLLTPYADDEQGYLMLPEVGSQVVVGFEAGDPRRPYVVGACFNGAEALPEAPTAANNKRLIQSRARSRFEFDDTAGAAKVTISMQSGHTLVLDDGAQEVQLRHANGSLIKIDAAGTVTITANATVDVNASLVNVHAPMAVFDGVVQCQTLIANAVVASTYTPGAGNVW